MHFSGPSLACVETSGEAAASGGGTDVVVAGFGGAGTGAIAGSLANGGAKGVATGLDASAPGFPGTAFGDSFPAGAAEGTAAGVAAPGSAAGVGFGGGGAVGAVGATGGLVVPQPTATRLITPVTREASMVERRMWIPQKSGPSIVLSVPGAPYGSGNSQPGRLPPEGLAQRFQKLFPPRIEIGFEGRHQVAIDQGAAG